MTMYELLDELQTITAAATYQTDEILYFMGKMLCCEELCGCMQVVNTEERDAFLYVSDQLLQMVDLSNEEPRQKLEQLQSLMALQDMYIHQDPGFDQAQSRYFADAVEREVLKRTRGLQEELSECEQRLAGKDMVILQLRQSLNEKPAVLVDTEEVQRLTAENRRLKKQLEDQKSASQMKSVKTVKTEPPVAQKKPQQATVSSKMPDELFYLCGKSGNIYSDSFHQTKLDNMTDRQCSQIQELGIISCGGTLGELGNRLMHRFSGLKVLLLTEAVRCLSPGAVKNCPALKMILFQEKNCFIQEQPEALKQVTLIADPGGNVEAYAQKHQIRFRPLQENNN